MDKLPLLSQKVRFGKFAIDPRAGEIQKNGRKIRLPEQPFRILMMLVERPGEVVTREELRLKLWPADTFVDFDHGLNNAINRIREVLGDSAENPRFIETLPRRGYRFLAPVEGGAEPKAPEASPSRPVPPRKDLWVIGTVAGAVVALIGLAVFFNLGGLRDRLLGRSAPDEITSIAVLPLENLTGDSQQEYFVDGLHDELITQLAQVGSLKVISRTSVMRYKKEKPPLREIGRALGVEGVLEGTVRREGGRLQVTAQLISVRDDRHVWARSYDRDLREAPAIPGEVARAVSETLNLKLTPQEQTQLARAKPVNPAAYAAFLKGKYFTWKFTNEGLHKAIAYFHEAVNVDPGYAPAWAAIGECYEMLSGYGLRDDDLTEEEALLKARKALETAIALDPTLWKPYAILGHMKLKAWDWAGGEKYFERVRKIDPAREGGSPRLILTGQFDQAVNKARESVRRNPLAYSAQLVLGWTYFMAWRYDESIAALKKAAEMEPQNHQPHFELAWNYAKQGKFDDAVSECQTSLKLLRRTDPDAVTATECGWVYGLAGRRREALEVARKLEKTVEETQDFTFVAHIYDALGQRENALKFLEKAYQARDPWLPRQWNMPIISDDLRADPRFQDLIRRTGIPWATFPPPGQSLASVVNKQAPQLKP